MSGYMRELESDGERLTIAESYIRQPPKETQEGRRAASSLA
jgi:hypothetical protein